MQQKFSLKIETFRFKDRIIRVYVPDYDSLRSAYSAEFDRSEDFIFPYWGKVWPSSIALCSYISEHFDSFYNRSILELAAGAGVPSFLVASAASTVICSDISEDAVSMLQRSIELQSNGNIRCQVLDWSDRLNIPSADFVLLSDVNYYKEQLDTLFTLISDLLFSGSKILLTTPERIVARDFLLNLQPFEIEHHVYVINDEHIHLYVFACDHSA